VSRPGYLVLYMRAHITLTLICGVLVIAEPHSIPKSCMMLNEGIGCGSGETPARMVWRKLSVIGGTAFASEGAANEILIMVGVKLIW